LTPRRTLAQASGGIDRNGGIGAVRAEIDRLWESAGFDFRPDRLPVDEPGGAGLHLARDRWGVGKPFNGWRSQPALPEQLVMS